MQDFQTKMTIKMSGKNHYALIDFLKKHGGNKDDVSRFVEEAVVNHIVDREIAFHRARHDHEDVALFPNVQTAEAIESWPL